MFNQLSTSSVDMTSGRYPAVPLEECIEDITNGYCIRPVKQKTGHKMLKLNALQPTSLDLTETKYVKISDEIGKRFQIAEGDLLICRSVGSFSHIAKCALVTEDHPDIVFPDTMIRARFNKQILPAYAREVIQSSIGRAWF
jgi:type I restriction enzyme S subunit